MENKSPLQGFNRILKIMICMQVTNFVTQSMAQAFLIKDNKDNQKLIQVLSSSIQYKKANKHNSKSNIMINQNKMHYLRSQGQV